MNKSALVLSGLIGVLVLTAVVLHALPINGDGHFPHNDSDGNGESVTIKLNEPGFARCGQPFFDSVYELTKEVFSVGAENVELSEYENQLFALIRSGETFKGDPHAFIDHIKAIPAQTIDIVKEDPEVLDSCENFQVAMVGPP